jgi:hypothetical protein
LGSVREGALVRVLLDISHQPGMVAIAMAAAIVLGSLVARANVLAVVTPKYPLSIPTRSGIAGKTGAVFNQ